jgi:hypothetical protein
MFGDDKNKEIRSNEHGLKTHVFVLIAFHFTRVPLANSPQKYYNHGNDSKGAYE